MADQHPPWPKPGEHLWDQWRADQPRRGTQPPTQYRTCLHPKCKTVEHRQAPAG